MAAWRYEVPVNQITGRIEDETADEYRAVARDLADTLKAALWPCDREELEDVIERLEELGDDTDDYWDAHPIDLRDNIDFELGQLYEYGDTTRIWMGI